MIKTKRIVPLLFFLAVVLLAGCKGKTADDYVKERLEQVQSGDDDAAEYLLDQGIEKMNDTYIEAFPEELRDPYREFLKESCKKFQFEILECNKYNSGYKVRVELTPVNIGKTVEETDQQYIENLQSVELVKEVQGLLEKDTPLLEKAEEDQHKKLTIYVKKKDSGYQIEQSEWENCISLLLSGYMDPYKHVADTLDARDYLQAILDASYKGDVTRYAKHVGKTEDEALAEYEASFAEIDLSDLELTPEQETRFMEAMKTIFKNSQYELGLVRKNKENGYTIEVTVTSNLSLLESGNTFGANVDNGKYNSVEQAKEGYLSLVESYAAAPVYGETVTKEINMSTGQLLLSGSGNSELDRLGELIMPSME